MPPLVLLMESLYVAVCYHICAIHCIQLVFSSLYKYYVLNSDHVQPCYICAIYSLKIMSLKSVLLYVAIDCFFVNLKRASYRRNRWLEGN